MQTFLKMRIIVTLSAAGMICVAGMNKSSAAPGYGRKADTVKQAPMPDKALANKFERLCRRVGNNSGNYTLGGIIKVTDKTNVKDPVQTETFLFCKQGDEFYYKLGKTITINEKEGYVFADHDTRRVIISAKKEINYDPVLPGVKDIASTIRSENYAVKSTVAGNYETVSIINEHHISCKQYSITYDRKNNKITRLFIRLSNFQAPMRTDNEKIVDVSITEWDDRADLNKYPRPGDMVKRVNGALKTVNAYKNFELTQM